MPPRSDSNDSHHRSAALRRQAKARQQNASPAECPQDTHERLLTAARTLFARHGFDGTSVKDVCARAGVNISLISYHFGGKEGLYRACIEPFGRARLAAAQRVLQPPETREEFALRLRLFSEEVLTCHVENEEITQILHREGDMERMAASGLFQDTFLRTFETLIRFFETAQTRGLLAAQLQPQIVAGLMYGSILNAGKSDRINQKFFGKTIQDPQYRAQIVETIALFCTTGCLSPTPIPSLKGQTE